MKGHTTIYDDTLALARKHAKAGNPTEAARLYERVLKAAPQHKKAKKELNALKRASGAGLKSPPLQDQLAELMNLYSNGKPDSAEAAAKRLCRLYPDQPMPFNIVGAVQAARGDFTAAIGQYKKALTIEPNYPDALNNMGIALAGLNRFKEAAPCFARALALQPRDASAYVNMAAALHAAEDFEAAVQAYENAIDLQPLVTRTHIALGRTLIAMGKLNQAIVSFRNCLEIEPENVEAKFLIGEVLAAQGSMMRAASWYRDALAIDATQARIHRRLGIALLRDGEKEEAVQALTQCLALDPADSTAKHFLAVAQNDLSQTPPLDYVTEMFDDYAPTFEKHLLEKLGYRTPEVLKELLLKSTPERSSFANAADLGCGTGLSGLAFTEMAEHLVGIDLSGEMISKAREKGVYDELYVGSIIDVLRQADTSFDLFICADTLVYFSKLEEIFQTVSGRAQPDALFVLSTESSDTDDIALRASGRYAHSRDYLLEVARSAGFELVAEETSNLRMEYADWIKGTNYILRYTQ
jgi:predicted TPR repeat methyltransferase